MWRAWASGGMWHGWLTTLYVHTKLQLSKSKCRHSLGFSSAAKAQKLKGIQLPPIVAKLAGCPLPQNENNQEMEEAHQESIEALQKLFEGRASVPHQTVQCILDSTRPHREQCLRTPVSIDNVIQKYPAFKLPKWVRIHVSGCIHIHIATALTCTGLKFWVVN